MQYTEIRLSVSLTHNLGNYSNIKPVVQLTATIHAYDDVYNVLDTLQHRALAQCYAVIDEHLELEGQPAHYSQDERFAAVIFKDERLAYIVPEGAQRYFYQAGFEPTRTLDGYRKAPLIEKIEKLFPDFATVELEKREQVATLPPMVKVCWASVAQEKLLVFGRGSKYDLPLYLIDTPGDVQTENQYRIYDIFAREMLEDPRFADYCKVDLSNPDFDTVPEIVRLRERWELESRQQAATPDDDPFDEPDDDDDEEEEEDE